MHGRTNIKFEAVFTTLDGVSGYFFGVVVIFSKAILSLTILYCFQLNVSFFGLCLPYCYQFISARISLVLASSAYLLAVCILSIFFRLEFPYIILHLPYCCQFRFIVISLHFLYCLLPVQISCYQFASPLFLPV